MAASCTRRARVVVMQERQNPSAEGVCLNLMLASCPRNGRVASCRGHATVLTAQRHRDVRVASHPLTRPCNIPLRPDEIRMPCSKAKTRPAPRPASATGQTRKKYNDRGGQDTKKHPGYIGVFGVFNLGGARPRGARAAEVFNLGGARPRPF